MLFGLIGSIYFYYHDKWYHDIRPPFDFRISCMGSIVLFSVTVIMMIIGFILHFLFPRHFLNINDYGFISFLTGILVSEIVVLSMEYRQFPPKKK